MNHLHQLVKDYGQLINPLLHKGEDILWVGKPQFWPFLMMGSWWMIPFSVVWGGFFIFLEFLMINEKSLEGILIILPFFIFGLYLIVGRFWIGAKRWNNTFYFVTDRRLMIRTGAFSLKTLIWDLAKLPTVDVKLKRSGIGHINFVGIGKWIYTNPHLFGLSLTLFSYRGLFEYAPSLRYVEDPLRVYELAKLAWEQNKVKQKENSLDDEITPLSPEIRASPG